ncbi:acetolactate synthase small subunit [Cohnella xylanilytica]|nr:acetolactate synthase small subunit [Cohnella xylanilytica]
MERMETKEYISVLVLDTPGVLQRVSGLFARRGYNIDSITVGSSEREGMSRMIVAARGDDRQIGQICSQLAKLIDVVAVIRLNERPAVARELMLIKLTITPEHRLEVQHLIDTFRCSIIDAGTNVLIVQVVGDKEKNDAFLQLVKSYGILEVTRTGETAMNRG